VPGHVEEELRGYLECGILCFGFARALCTGCGQGFVVAFSCKGRGVCPSCNGRHMAQTAAHLAVSFLHRFGSALNHHVHLHVCATDGVFVPNGDGPPAFLPAHPITHVHLVTLTERVRRRVIRWFRLAHLLDASAAADIRLIAFRLFYQCETIPGLRTVGNLRLLRSSCPRAGADPENPYASWRTARAATSVARSWPAHRLGRARADP